MISAVMSGFALSLAAPWLQRLGRSWTGWMLAVLPISLAIYFASLIGPITVGSTLAVSYAWVPSLGINLSFFVDGLSLVFALLISGIGGLVIIYGGGYLAGDPYLGRFYAYILMFMASMLGLVLADNIFTLFIFWELTSLSSYLLIGFKHEQADSRAAALQALLVTGAGGLALLAGLVLLSVAGGSQELSTLLTQGDMVRRHDLYLPILSLVLLGAFTKSAQFPFHFWLPGAMAAPTPVSSYLHSATMVKAGVYLLARLSPILGGTFAWQQSVTVVGTITMLVGAYIAWQQADLKRILAYSTISALGTLMMLVGLGTPLAVKAMVVFLIVHSLYKGALFMAAGAIDHETGTRDVRQLGGLRHMMPITFVAVILAALSMAGALPLFVGYIGKKLIYEATLSAPNEGIILTTAAMLANIFTIVAAGLVAYRPFFGQSTFTSRQAHEAPVSMWLGPTVLAGFGLLVVGLIEFVPDNLFKPLVASSATAVLMDELAGLKLSVWSGLNLVFELSLVTVIVGVVAYVERRPLRRLVQPLDALAVLGPAQWYKWSLNGMLALANFQTRLLQNGYLRYYLLTIIAATVALISFTLTRQVALPGLTFSEIRIYEAVVVALILAATLVTVFIGSRLAAVAALGVVGYGVALIYILFSAPDLAMTQFAIETLSVILLVLVLYRLPRFTAFTTLSHRLRDAVVALAAGATMTILVLVINAVPTASQLTPYFAQNSLIQANGRNVVNVILVDFRAMDTLGEITVLAVAAIGVYALLKLRLGQKKNDRVIEGEARQVTATAIHPILNRSQAETTKLTNYEKELQQDDSKH